MILALLVRVLRLLNDMQVCAKDPKLQQDCVSRHEQYQCIIAALHGTVGCPLGPLS